MRFSFSLSHDTFEIKYTQIWSVTKDIRFILAYSDGCDSNLLHIKSKWDKQQTLDQCSYFKHKGTVPNGAKNIKQIEYSEEH
jgi:hypothetical protein